MGLMDVFKGKQSQSSVDMNTNAIGSGLVKADGGFSSSNSTVSVTEEVAFNIAALYQGISIISDTIAAMPVLLHKEEDGFQHTLYEDSRCRVLSGMANEVLTSFNLKKSIIKDLILYGNAYAKIIREGENIKLYYLPKGVVNPKVDNSGYYFEVAGYSTDVMGERHEAEVVDYFDMLALIRNPKHNSMVGQGLLDYAADTISMSTQETSYMINLFKNGLSAKAVLSSKTPFKKEIKDQLKRDLQEFYSGYSNAGKMMVLEGDISVLPLALTPTDIRLIENVNLSITQIARFLNIPKHMLNLDRGQGTYSNITQERLQLLQNTLTPYVVAIEEALNQKLLTEEEIAAGYYFQFNTADMLKLTPEDNANYMINLYDKNIVTLEEVRATLNLGGDADIIAELKEYQALRLNKVKSELSTDVKVDENTTKTVGNTDEVKPKKKEKTPKKEKSE